jgi:hypothetical protein
MSLVKFELPIFEGFSNEVIIWAFKEIWNHGKQLDWIEETWKEEFAKLIFECSNGEVKLIEASNPNRFLDDWFFFLVKGSQKKAVESHYSFDSITNIFEFPRHIEYWK